MNQSFGTIVSGIGKTVRRRLGLPTFPRERGVTWRISGAFIDDCENAGGPRLVGDGLGRQSTSPGSGQFPEMRRTGTDSRYACNRQPGQHTLYLVPKVSNRR